MVKHVSFNRRTKDKIITLRNHGSRSINKDKKNHRKKKEQSKSKSNVMDSMKKVLLEPSAREVMQPPERKLEIGP